MIRSRFHRKDGSNSIASQAFGMVGIFLVLFLTYLSVDPEAHERIHHDAKGGNHHCVISAYAAGEALFLAPVPLLRPQLASFARVQWQALESPHPEGDWVLRPSCGPPPARFSA